MEIRHAPSCYDKNQLPLLASTLLVLFDKTHVKQFSVPPKTSRLNEYNVVFPRNEEGRVDVGRSVYETSNQPNKGTFKYEQDGLFYIGVSKVESK